MCDCPFSKFPIKRVIFIDKKDSYAQVIVSEEQYQEIKKLKEDNPEAKLIIKGFNDDE